LISVFVMTVMLLSCTIHDRLPQLGHEVEGVVFHLFVFMIFILFWTFTPAFLRGTESDNQCEFHNDRK
jgi:hypothetical protein